MSKQQPNKPKPEEPKQKAEPVIPQHRQCPLCFTGRGGVGVAYNTQRRGKRILLIGDSETRTTYYRCQCCGHTWSAQVRLEVLRVEHRVVTIEGQR